MIISDEITARFWSKVDIRGPDDCWPWLAYIDKTTGYGRFGTLYPEVVGSHRYSFASVNGDPGELFVRHRCDNRPCCNPRHRCNPRHLLSGTHQDNVDDMMERGRYVSGVAELSEQQIIDIRVRRHSGELGTIIASEYGMSPQHINSICRGTYWPNIGGPLTERFIISDDTIWSVQVDLAAGLTKAECVEKYQISKASVEQIASGRKQSKFPLCFY